MTTLGKIVSIVLVVLGLVFIVWSGKWWMNHQIKESPAVNTQNPTIPTQNAQYDISKMPPNAKM